MRFPSLRLFIASLIAAAVMSALLIPTSVAATPGLPNDINGDGAADLIIGVPLEGVSGNARAGSVNVIYSNGSRLVKAGNQAIDQSDIGATVGPDDLFGSAVALVDVNGDGFADAIIGSSGEPAGVEVNAGAFAVVEGSADGLDVTTGRLYRQGADGLPETAELDDFFGYSIAGGDFDNDGYGDVAIAAPFEDVDGVVDVGRVMVIPGSADGLDMDRAVLLQQTTSSGDPEAGDFFGWSMTAGDFDRDGRDDLAVGVPGEDVGENDNAGSVTVFMGTAGGISTEPTDTFSQRGPVKNSAESEDLFGFSLASSDMDCDGWSDLLIGVPNEGLGRNGIIAGMVNVLLGSNDGLTTSGNRRLAQGVGGVAGQRDFNQFGAALAAGDFDGDGCGDIAISAHTTDVGGDGVRPCIADSRCESEAGAVIIVYGSERWPRIGGTASLTQRGPIRGKSEAGDFFGRTLSTLDANGDGRDDLAIGTPREDFRNARDAGIVTIVRGSRDGLTTARDYSFTQAGSIAGKREPGDQFGSSLPGATS